MKTDLLKSYLLVANKYRITASLIVLDMRILMLTRYMIIGTYHLMHDIYI